VCERCLGLGHTNWDPALRACDCCTREKRRCVRVCVLIWCADSESTNKGAMYIMERLRADGRMHRSLLNLRPLPDPAHVGKCMWDGLCNWVLVMDDNRICMQFLRTLREALPELAKLLPLFPLTCRDQQAPENLLHASTEPVMQQLQGIARVCHQICPEKWRKWLHSRSA
jgi:hypothetical protein